MFNFLKHKKTCKIEKKQEKHDDDDLVFSVREFLQLLPDPGKLLANEEVEDNTDALEESYQKILAQLEDMQGNLRKMQANLPHE